LSFRARDKARARQCYLKAFQLAAGPEDRAEAGLDLAGALEVGIGAEVFRLTDLSVLPEPEREAAVRWFHETDEFLLEGRSPVIGPNGEWRLPELRDRFEEARTDGERIYWLLSEVVRISPAHAAPAKLELGGAVGQFARRAQLGRGGLSLHRGDGGADTRKDRSNWRR
jgi:hypothetical protein